MDLKGDIYFNKPIIGDFSTLLSPMKGSIENQEKTAHLFYG